VLQELRDKALEWDMLYKTVNKGMIRCNTTVRVRMNPVHSNHRPQSAVDMYGLPPDYRVVAYLTEKLANGIKGAPLFSEIEQFADRLLLELEYETNSVGIQSLVDHDREFT
jgi:hypothetical protein